MLSVSPVLAALTPARPRETTAMVPAIGAPPNGDENVRVLVRVKPPLDSADECCLQMDGEHVTITAPTRAYEAPAAQTPRRLLMDGRTGAPRTPRSVRSNVKRADGGGGLTPRNTPRRTPRHGATTPRMGTPRGPLQTPREQRAEAAPPKRFEFDAVFDGSASQLDVFEHTKLIVDRSLDGNNGTILAYGQTGSGKTHTMFGTELDEGVVLRAVDRIFEKVESSTGRVDWSVKLTFVELYNDSFRDLLAPAPPKGATPWEIDEFKRRHGTIQLREARAGRPGAPPVTFLTGSAGFDSVVHDKAHFRALLRQGLAARATSSTRMNTQSSRSHAIITLRLDSTVESTVSGMAPVTRSGKLHLVDLAGSEALDRNADAVMSAETRSINSSLTALCDVLGALSRNGRSANAPAPVPWRNHKLTRLLADALGGGASTLMVAALQPGGAHFRQSLTTLKYASRARDISASVATALVTGAEETAQALAPLKQKVLELQARLERRETEIVSLETLNAAREQQTQRALGELRERSAEEIAERQVSLTPIFSPIRHAPVSPYVPPRSARMSRPVFPAYHRHSPNSTSREARLGAELAQREAELLTVHSERAGGEYALSQMATQLHKAEATRREATLEVRRLDARLGMREEALQEREAALRKLQAREEEMRAQLEVASDGASAEAARQEAEARRMESEAAITQLKAELAAAREELSAAREQAVAAGEHAAAANEQAVAAGKELSVAKAEAASQEQMVAAAVAEREALRQAALLGQHELTGLHSLLEVMNEETDSTSASAAEATLGWLRVKLAECLERYRTQLPRLATAEQLAGSSKGAVGAAEKGRRRKTLIMMEGGTPKRKAMDGGTPRRKTFVAEGGTPRSSKRSRRETQGPSVVAEAAESITAVANALKKGANEGGPAGRKDEVSSNSSSGEVGSSSDVSEDALCSGSDGEPAAAPEAAPDAAPGAAAPEAAAPEAAAPKAAPEAAAPEAAPEAAPDTEASHVEAEVAEMEAWTDKALAAAAEEKSAAAPGRDSQARMLDSRQRLQGAFRATTSRTASEGGGGRGAVRPQPSPRARTVAHSRVRRVASSRCS